MVLALGIGIQNFPEGAAVSIPLSQEKMGKTKAFMWGQASALVEPVFAVLGAVLVTSMSVILPYALAFAAGAMIYVVVEELIPEAQENATSGTHFAVFGFMLGLYYDDFRCRKLGKINSCKTIKELLSSFLFFQLCLII